MRFLKPKEVAAKLNVSVQTLQIWDRKQILPAYRTVTGRRCYTEEQIEGFIKEKMGIGLEELDEGEGSE